MEHASRLAVLDIDIALCAVQIAGVAAVGSEGISQDSFADDPVPKQSM